VIVSEKFVEKVDRFGADEMLVLAVDESLPALPRMSATNHTTLALGRQASFVASPNFVELFNE